MQSFSKEPISCFLISLPRQCVRKDIYIFSSRTGNLVYLQAYMNMLFSFHEYTSMCQSSTGDKTISISIQQTFLLIFGNIWHHSRQPRPGAFSTSSNSLFRYEERLRLQGKGIGLCAWNVRWCLVQEELSCSIVCCCCCCSERRS